MNTHDLLVKMGATEANATKFGAALEAAMQEFSINTADRVAMFIAQVMHESGKLAFVSENLNYKAASLDAVFPKYFKNAGRSAAEYARQPEKIANVVYASRMGNGDTASGDGFRYRGRGLIQLTGKNNYSAMAGDMGITVEECALYLETPEGACESAAWFWHKNGLNALADKDDVTAVTKRINGGTIGLEDRKSVV